jgi:molecular chaperone GrpE
LGDARGIFTCGKGEKRKMTAEFPADPERDLNLQADGNESAAADADLQAELSACRAQAEEYLDGWQRARADFTNYKKRIERDQVQTQQNAVASVVKRYLEILDDLDRALKHRPTEGEGALWAGGIEQIYRKLLTLLEREGVTPMDLNNAAFDPNLHEAITAEESADHESGQIIDVLQQGYLIGDRVLRPALVRVAK